MLLQFTEAFHRWAVVSIVSKRQHDCSSLLVMYLKCSPIDGMVSHSLHARHQVSFYGGILSSPSLCGNGCGIEA